MIYMKNLFFFFGEKLASQRYMMIKCQDS